MMSYRVPAKCRERLETRVTLKSLPYIEPRIVLTLVVTSQAKEYLLKIPK